MKQLHNTQRGFAAPAMFIAVIVAFVGSLAVKTEDGITVAQAIGNSSSQPESEFAATEIKK